MFSCVIISYEFENGVIFMGKYGVWWANVETNPDNNHVQSESWGKTGYKAYSDLEEK